MSTIIAKKTNETEVPRWVKQVHRLLKDASQLATSAYSYNDHPTRKNSTWWKLSLSKVTKARKVWKDNKGGKTKWAKDLTALNARMLRSGQPAGPRINLLACTAADGEPIDQENDTNSAEFYDPVEDLKHKLQEMTQEYDKLTNIHQQCPSASQYETMSRTLERHQHREAELSLLVKEREQQIESQKDKTQEEKTDHTITKAKLTREITKRKKVTEQLETSTTQHDLYKQQVERDAYRNKQQQEELQQQLAQAKDTIEGFQKLVEALYNCVSLEDAQRIERELACQTE